MKRKSYRLIGSSYEKRAAPTFARFTLHWDSIVPSRRRRARSAPAPWISFATWVNRLQVCLSRQKDWTPSSRPLPRSRRQLTGFFNTRRFSGPIRTDLSDADFWPGIVPANLQRNSLVRTSFDCNDGVPHTIRSNKSKGLF
jgi:hypothetical protein